MCVIITPTKTKVKYNFDAQLAEKKLENNKKEFTISTFQTLIHTNIHQTAVITLPTINAIKKNIQQSSIYGKVQCEYIFYLFLCITLSGMYTIYRYMYNIIPNERIAVCVLHAVLKIRQLFLN